MYPDEALYVETLRTLLAFQDGLDALQAVLRSRLATAEKDTSTFARSALVKPEYRATALESYGRERELKDLLSLLSKIRSA